jgi:hypothetical protein
MTECLCKICVASARQSPWTESQHFWLDRVEPFEWQVMRVMKRKKERQKNASLLSSQPFLASLAERNLAHPLGLEDLGSSETPVRMGVENGVDDVPTSCLQV